MNNKLSENLRYLRSQRGLTQKELASHLHCSISTVSNHENGVHEPDCGTLAHLADFYGVTVDYLLGRADKQYPDSLRNRPIYGKYTLGRFLQLMDTLPEKHLPRLTDYFRLLEEISDNGQDS